MLLTLLACNGQPDDSVAPSACEDPVSLQDAHNYRFSGALDVAEVAVAAWTDEAPTDYLIDWSAVTTDLQGHPLDPAADVDMVTLVAFPLLTPAEIEVALSSNDLQQADIAAYAFATVSGATSVQLSELGLPGNDIDIEQYLTEGSATWMLLLASGTVPGLGTRLLSFVLPTTTSGNLDIRFDDTSTLLDFEVDLASSTPVGMPADVATITWDALTVDGLGHPLDAADIDTVKIAWFADTSYEDLAADFLDVERNADELWQAPIASGASLEVSALTGSTPFDATLGGTYALALQCSACSNPAPLFFGQLQPCE